MMHYWLHRLSYGLRVTAGWFAAGWLAFALLRQSYRNSQILRWFHRELRLKGVPLPTGPPGLIRTSLQHYGRLLRAVPKLADDEAEFWARRLQALHQELQIASKGHSAARKLLIDRDARELQFEFLQRFFRSRLRIELAPPGDAFAGYLPGVEGLCDFFDFCASRGRLTSREEVEKALGEFARLVQQYRVHFRRNPPRGHWGATVPTRTPFRHRLTPLLRPAGLLAQIYWGKNHAERVIQGLSLPPWAAKIIIEGLAAPSQVPRHRLLSVLVYETCLHGHRLLAEQCSHLATLPASPKLFEILRKATTDLLGAARFLSTAWSWQELK